MSVKESVTQLWKIHNTFLYPIFLLPLWEGSSGVVVGRSGGGGW